MLFMYTVFHNINPTSTFCLSLARPFEIFLSNTLFCPKALQCFALIRNVKLSEVVKSGVEKSGVETFYDRYVRG